MLGPALNPQRLAGAATIALIVFLGLLAYPYTPKSGPGTNSLYICLGTLLLGIAVGWGVARLFRGATPDPVIDGVALWVGALVTYPAFRYIHDGTDWLARPGAGEYTVGRHALAMLVPVVLFLVGGVARRRS